MFQKSLTLLDVIRFCKIHFPRHKDGLILDTTQTQLPVNSTAPTVHPAVVLASFRC